MSTVDGPGRRAGAWLAAAAVLALVGVLMLAVFPARTLADQRHERAEATARLTDLVARNQRLDDQAKLLQTDAEIERLARQHYNLVKPDEEVFAILPRPKAAAPMGPAAPTATAAAPSRPAPIPWWRKGMGLVTDVF